MCNILHAGVVLGWGIEERRPKFLPCCPKKRYIIVSYIPEAFCDFIIYQNAFEAARWGDSKLPQTLRRQVIWEEIPGYPSTDLTPLHSTIALSAVIITRARADRSELGLVY